jgi:hypothetical protein
MIAPGALKNRDGTLGFSYWLKDTSPSVLPAGEGTWSPPRVMLEN